MPESDTPDPKRPKRYPPPGHVLRHLRLVVDARAVDDTTSTMPVLRDLCDDEGVLRLGPLAMLVDMTAGVQAAHAVRPDWTVTFDLELDLLGDARPSGDDAEPALVHTRCQLVRQGRSQVISESHVMAHDGSPVARAVLTFNRLTPRGDTPTPDTVDYHLDLAERDEAPRTPLDEFLGFVTDERAGTVRFDHIPVLHNSIGAIQGGVIALAVERAASLVGNRELGRPTRTRHLHVYYLALGRTGPFEARTTVLEVRGDSVLSRIELVDTGDNDRVLAMASGRAVAI